MGRLKQLDLVGKLRLQVDEQPEHLGQVWLNSVVGLALVEALVLLARLPYGERAIFERLDVMVAVDQLEARLAALWVVGGEGEESG